MINAKEAREKSQAYAAANVHRAFALFEQTVEQKLGNAIANKACTLEVVLPEALSNSTAVVGKFTALGYRATVKQQEGHISDTLYIAPRKVLILSW